MNDANTQALLSAIRSLLMVIGGVLASHGFLSESAVNEAIGAVMVILPAAYGIWDKYRAEAKTQVRETAAVQAGIAAAPTVSSAVAVSPEKAQAIIENHTGVPQP